MYSMDPGYPYASKNFAKNSVFTFMNASKTGVHLPGLLSTSFLFHVPTSRTHPPYHGGRRTEVPYNLKIFLIKAVSIQHTFFNIVASPHKPRRTENGGAL